jgi:hypothetical protein
MELVKSWELGHLGLIDIAIQQNVCALVNLQFFSHASTRVNDLGPQKNSCEKMEGFSQNAYEYILEKCVGSFGESFSCKYKKNHTFINRNWPKCNHSICDYMQLLAICNYIWTFL